MKLKQVLTPQKLASLVNPPETKSLQEIGQMFGVSRQRVHQILNGYKAEYPHLFVEQALPSAMEIALAPSLSHLSREYGVSVGRLKSLMKKENLTREPVMQKISEEALYHLYVHMEWSDKDIAEVYGCSPHTVMKLRYTYDIHAKLRSSLEDKLTKDCFEELYMRRGFHLSQIAQVYEVGVQQIAKLKEKYGVQRKRNPRAKGASPDDIEQAIKERHEVSVELREQQTEKASRKEGVGK